MFRTVAGLPSHPNSSNDPLMTAMTNVPENVPYLDHERQMIDVDLAKAEEHIRALKSRRNELASISQLPPEMISKIFMFVSESSPAHRPLAWITVSQVCRHWRDTALGCPRLWSSPVFSLPKWAGEMIIRSKLAPLTIMADLTYLTPKMTDAISTALEQVSRTVEIRLTISQGSLEKLIPSLKSSATVLHTLSIKLTGRSYPSYNPPVTLSNQGILPNDLFQGEAPNLRHLEFATCSLAWDSPLYNDAILSFKLLSGDTVRPSMDDLTNILNRMPSLEVLHLEDALPLEPDLTTPLSTVHLRRLTSLQLSGTGVKCANLLNRITIGPLSTLSLKLAGTGNKDVAFESLLPSLSRTIRAAMSDKSLRSLEIVHLPSCIKITGWLNMEKLFAKPEFVVQLSTFPIQQGRAETVISSLLDALPLTNIRAIIINSNSPYTNELRAELWIKHLSLLPKLRSIHLKGEYGSEFMKVLKSNAARKTKGHLKHFPALRKLKFSAVDFTSILDKGRPWFKDLYDWLIMRCEYKAAIYEIALEDCIHFYDDEYDLLKGVVATVKWDYVVHDSEEEDEEEDGDEDYDDDFFGDNFPFAIYSQLDNDYLGYGF